MPPDLNVSNSATASSKSVHVVEDDPAVRSALGLFLRVSGFLVHEYASAEEFLAADGGALRGCALVDVRLPGMDGPTLQVELQARRSALPVVLMTAYAEVPLAVRAMRAGAVDFIEKPVEPAALLEAIGRALTQPATNILQPSKAVAADAANRISALSPRERNVLQGLLAGYSNKDIARRLGLSPRTVEIHRARMMGRLGARSLPEALRLGLAAGIEPVIVGPTRSGPERHPTVSGV